MRMNHLLAASVLTGLLAASNAFAANISNLDNLPNRGTVSVSGVVDSVNGKRLLTLRDETGRTIEVTAKNDVTVSEGDQVEVNGTVQSASTGMGKEISSATVMRTAANNTRDRTTNSGTVPSNPINTQ